MKKNNQMVFKSGNVVFNRDTSVPGKHKNLQQVSKIVKCGFVFMFVFILGARAELYSQQHILNLQLKQASLAKVFEQMEKQTGLRFLYNTRLIESKGKVDVQAQQQDVRMVLEDVLKPLHLDYVIENEQVVVKNASNIPQVDTKVKIQGIVKSDKGEKLPGVTIQIKGTSLGTVTGADGTFELDLPATSVPVLVFSFVGLRTQEVKYTGQQKLEIIMQENSAEMSEVVVTGYQTIAREKVTGATSSVSSKELSERYTPNVLDNLEGRVAGLMTYDGKTTIRGTNSLNVETQPLLVIDGLPVEGKLEDINPYDVESITVLKDAAASAIYGARASNGIIVIKTKGAKEIEGINVEASANFTVYQKRNLDYADNFYLTPEQQVEKEKEYYDYYFFNNNGEVKDPIGTTEKAINSGYEPVSPIQYAYLQFAKKEIDQSEFDQRLQKFKRNNFAKDYAEHILRNRFLQQYNVAVRSRSEKFQSNLVLNYKRDNTGIKQAYNNQVNIFYKGSYDMASWLTANFSINGILSKSKESNSEFTKDPFNVPAYYSLFDENGEYAYYTASSWANAFYSLPEESPALKSMGFNHLEELSFDQKKIDRRNMRYHGDLLFRIAEGITVNTQFVYETERQNESSYAEAESYIMRYMRNVYTVQEGKDFRYLIPETGGKLATVNTLGEYWTARGQLNFNRRFGKHAIDFLGGFEFRQTKYNGTRGLLLGYDEQLQSDATVTVNFPELSRYTSSTYYAPAFPAKQEMYDQYIDPAIRPVVEQYHRYASGYANITYTFDNKYNAFASFRKDYADVYGLNAKFRGKPLWSVGASWNLRNETFMHEMEWINFLKVRISYGVTGNIYQGATSYMTASSSGFNNRTQLPWSKIESPGNPELKWEQTRTTNVGFDFSLVNNRLKGSFEWYHRKGTDIFSEKTLDPSKGYKTMVMNMAGLKNNGVELSLTGDWFRTSDRNRFAWTTSLTMAYNKNEITKVDVKATKAYELITQKFKEGYPVNALFSYRYAGVNDKGQATWYGAEDNVVTSIQSAGIDVLAFSGQTDPKLSMGMENRFNYKGVSLNLMMVYYGGHKMRVLQAVPSTKLPVRAMPSYYQDSWTPGNTSTNVPGVGQYAAALITQGESANTDIYVQPADFIKIRNVVIGYDLPKHFFSKIGLQDVNVRFQVDNPRYLWVKNKVKVDPETKSVRRLTSYIFGINFNF